MDTISKLYLRASELEDLIERCIEEERPEQVADYQEELDHVTTKIAHLENDTRKSKTKKTNGLEWQLF